jgi:hypothetical protein
VSKTAKLATLLCAALCCGTELAAESGDFGRPRESIFADEFLPWLKDGFDTFTGRSVASAPYTDDERTLRDLAFAILEPPELSERSRFAIAGVDFFELWSGWIVGQLPFDVRSYADHLIDKPYRSHTARYSQLIDDIRADAGRINPFFTLANRVLESDTVRVSGFQYITRLQGGTFDLARIRIAENRGLIDKVYDRFRERLESYRYALECLLVLTPSPNAIEAERALFVLEERLRRMTTPVIVVTSPAAPIAPGGVISK